MSPASLIAPADLRRHLCHRGGVTLDPATGTALREGIAVCPDRRWSRWLHWPALDEESLRGWLHQLHQHLEPDRFLGAWVEPGSGRVWIEAVVIVPGAHAERAMRLATLAGQRAVYDLDADRLLPVVAAAQ